MAWVVRQFTKGQIDRAGASLAGQPTKVPITVDEFRQVNEALDIINNWRAAHGYPLQAIKMTLKRRAKRVHQEAIVAQRLKRLPSIALKLRHNPNMKLSQMQDLGGCRAIMPTIRDVRKLLAAYDEAERKNPQKGRPTQHEKYDYIECPKPDGYRSCHLIFKYQTQYDDKKGFEGQRVEIQVRSRLQHAWATAVETVQTFTGQALKSKIKEAEPEWLRFFELMGSAIAMREGCPLVPSTPANRAELIGEIRELSAKLSVEQSLLAWGMAVQQLLKQPGDAAVFLLVLDSVKKTLAATPFKSDQLREASEAYLKIEKETEMRAEIQAVLVSVESVDALREAYPNYYLDTSAFIAAMKQAIK